MKLAMMQNNNNPQTINNSRKTKSTCLSYKSKNQVNMLEKFRFGKEI